MPLTNAANYSLTLNIAIFLAAAAVVWLAGSRLTRHTDALALRRRFDRAFIGMLLLGGITSLPEVANVVTASANGSPALAVNNLLGSAAINVLLLAVADAIVGRRAVTGMVAQPSTMMMAALCMIILVVIAFAITLGDVAIPRLGIGAWSGAIGILSILCFWIAAGYDRRSHWSVDDADGDRGEQGDEEPEHSEAALWAGVALNGALIFAAGYALSQTGDAIAEQAGLTSAVVGFALIGTATSLPELVTVIAALRLRQPEMAFGQILGTNFVNLSLLPLGDAVFRGEPVINTLGRFETMLAMMAAVLIGVFIVGLLEHRNRTIFRMGIDSAIVMLLFAAGTAALMVV